jgi:hypothetical protein
MNVKKLGNILIPILILFFHFPMSVKGNTLELLPYPLYKSQFPLDHKEINTFLRFQNLNGRTSDEGKLALKTALLGWGNLQISSAAFVRLWMYPENMKFYVDRFLAALAVGLDYRFNNNLHGTLYPLFHESAHLADGHRGNWESDARIISVESVQLRFWYQKGLIQIPFRFDYYWHTIGPNWKYEGGTGLRLALPLWQTRAGFFLLEISGFGYMVSHGSNVRLNGEFQEGLLIQNGDRKLRIAFHYGYEYGSGQDWDQRQRSWGLNVGFGW